MRQISLNIGASKNLEAILTPRDLLDLYLYGITTKASDGSVIPNHIYVGYIMFAQSEIERYLDIKLKRQIIEEDKTYYVSDIQRWNMVQTSYPVETPTSMKGFYGTQQQIDLPVEWLSSKKSSDGVYNRVVHIVPNGGGAMSLQSIYGGMPPYFMFGTSDTVPNYWKLRYVTGFSKIPYEIFDVVGKLAAVNIFNVLGDIILGAGIASQSIGVDGLSQSIATTSSATNSGYGARVTQYLSELKTKLPAMRDYYGGIKFTCV